MNPPDDRPFVACAELLLGRGPASAEDYQGYLRAAYPHAIVHIRELASEPRVVWYVYRDGRWVPPGTMKPSEGNDADA